MMSPRRTVIRGEPAPRYFTGSWAAPCVIGGLGSALVAGTFFSFACAEAACLGGVIGLTLLCTTMAYTLLQQRPQLLLTPMPWFLLAAAVYFGFGPLIYFFGSDAAKGYCQDVWPVDTHEILRVTLVNVLGGLLVFGVWWWRAREMVQVKRMNFDEGATTSAITLFFIIGLPAQCVTFLSNWGFFDFVMPSSVGWVANFASAGLVLLTATAFRRGGAWWLLFGGVLALNVATAMANFSKAAIIMSVIPCIFGYMLYRPRLQVLYYWVPFIFLALYLCSYSFVSYSRSQSWLGKTFSARMNVAKSYFSGGRELEEKRPEDSQIWWIRLNYANVQAFAMKEYDQGRPGDSLALALVAPIPRILWPGKPIIESGYGLYTKLTGEEYVSFGVGFFTEAYWNGGWLYVILCAGAIGWLFGMVTLVVAKEHAAGNVWILPVALLWVRSGGRVDGWIHTEIVGPAVFTLLFLLLLRLWSRSGSPVPASDCCPQRARVKVNKASYRATVRQHRENGP